MASNSISDPTVNFNDQPTNQVQPTQTLPAQAPKPIGFMDFTNIEQAIKASELISQAPGFCPKDFLNKPAQILCAIQYGREIGLSPMQALQSIAVINGKPSIYGDGLIALCQSFSECEDIKEEFDAKTMTATCVVKRKGRSPVVHQWDVAKATKAGLWDKAGPWKQYPERMLQMRARGFALRDAFADRLKGIITAEEARDYPTQEERQFKVVTPINQNVKAIQQQLKQEREIKEVPANEHTIDKLQFLVKHCKVEQTIVDKWLGKAKVDELSKLSENQSQAVIQKLESEDSTANRAWILFNKSQSVYQEAAKQMPHGFFTDFTPEQCGTVLAEGVAAHA